jgi:hypothetical protein
MNLLEKNITYLQKKGVKWNLVRSKEDGTKNYEISSTITKDGYTITFLKDRKRTIYLGSKYNVKKEAKRWSSTVDFEDTTTLIVFGFGSGYYIKEVVEKMSDKNRLIIIEPSITIFEKTMEHIDLEEIFEDRDIYLNIGDFENDFFLKGIDQEVFSKTLVTTLPQYETIFPKQYLLFIQKVKENLRRISIELNTNIVFHKYWQNNLFRNLSYVLNSAQIIKFFDQFQDKPIFIVSAGPSLNKNVKQLHKAVGKAVIICVDTALKVLLKENIRPNMVISVDGHKLNYEKTKGISFDNIPYVYTPKVYYEMINDHKGEKFVYLCGDMFYEQVFKKFGLPIGNLMAGGSVACNALDLACKMGGNPIVFVGQDLAYTDQLTHAEGTMYTGKNKIDHIENSIIVESVDGGEVLTGNNLREFLHWFNWYIENNNSGITFVDATEGGAKIRGTKIQSLSQTIDQYCMEKIPVDQMIHDLFEAREKITSEHKKELYSYFGNIQSSFPKVVEQCEQGIKYAKELYDMYLNDEKDEARKENIFKELDDIDKYVQEQKELNGLMLDVMKPTINAIISIFVELKGETEQQKGMRVARKTEFLYKKIIEGIDFIGPFVKEVMNQISERKE